MAAAGIGFGVSLALIWGSRSALQQSPSALAIGQRGEQTAVRDEGQRNLDHEVSILIRLDEGPARPNVSATIIRPPQHGMDRGWADRLRQGHRQRRLDWTARPA